MGAFTLLCGQVLILTYQCRNNIYNTPKTPNLNGLVSPAAGGAWCAAAL
jgi:hypothetical protein